MHYPLVALLSLAGLGSHLGANARAILTDSKNATLDHRAIIPIHLPLAEPHPIKPIPVVDPIHPPIPPANPGVYVQPGLRPRDGNDVVPDSFFHPTAQQAALRKQWMCPSKKKRSEDLIKRTTFQPGDRTDPAKIFQWLESVGEDLDEPSVRLSPEKIVFYHGPDNLKDAQNFVDANNEYRLYDFFFKGGTTFAKDFGITEDLPGLDDIVVPASEALAKFARNPIVFSSTKSNIIQPLTLGPLELKANKFSAPDLKEYRLWPSVEWSVMQDAGSIRKMKAKALKDKDVDFKVDIPPKKCT